MPALIVRTGPRAGGRIEIDGEVVVGRGEVDWVIVDPELSRRHLAARARPGGVEVEDLGSLNGTWVDGRRLAGATVVADGGVICIGDTELVVDLGTARSAPAPAPTARSAAGVQPGAFAPAGACGRRRVASRMMVPALLTFLTIFATAVALIAYFATR